MRKCTSVWHRQNFGCLLKRRYPIDKNHPYVLFMLARQEQKLGGGSKVTITTMTFRVHLISYTEKVTCYAVIRAQNW